VTRPPIGGSPSEPSKGHSKTESVYSKVTQVMQRNLVIGIL
jgi:hypothetical protein